jgi:DNA-binding MarR family transcriptional regulator
MDDILAKTAARAVTTTPGTGRIAHRMALTTSRPELLVNGSDQEFRRLVHSLFGFLARHQKVREGHAAVIGLPGIEYTTLIAIRHLSAQGDVHVKTVADHLHLSGAFVTTVTNKLESKGLIEKAAHQGDRRRLSLTVKSRGAELLERLAPRQMQVNDVQFGCLSAREFQLLLDMVVRLIESSDRAIALQRYLAETTVQPIAPPPRKSALKPRKARKA